MISFLAPTASLHSSWLEALSEWDLDSQDGGSTFFAEQFGWDLTSPEDFAAWTELLLEMERGTVPEGFAPQTSRWIVSGDQFLGSVALRHELTNEYLQRYGGHVGYSVRPSARGRGLAKAGLREAMRIAAARGLGELLLTCDEDNVASAAVIESQGGVFERLVSRPDGQPVRRYWITLA